MIEVLLLATSVSCVVVQLVTRSVSRLHEEHPADRYLRHRQFLPIRHSHFCTRSRYPRGDSAPCPRAERRRADLPSDLRRTASRDSRRTPPRPGQRIPVDARSRGRPRRFPAAGVGRLRTAPPRRVSRRENRFGHVREHAHSGSPAAVSGDPSPATDAAASRGAPRARRPQSAVADEVEPPDHSLSGWPPGARSLPAYRVGKPPLARCARRRRNSWRTAIHRGSAAFASRSPSISVRRGREVRSRSGAHRPRIAGGAAARCSGAVEPNDRVAIEEPGYFGAHRALQSAGAQRAPVPVDAEGLNVATLQRRGTTLAPCTSRHRTSIRWG